MTSRSSGADNRPRTAVRSSASAVSSSATRSETVVSASGPKASTPWPPSRTACVPGRASISSMTPLTEGATGTSSAWPRRGSGSYRAGSGRPARANASRCGEWAWITAPTCGRARYTSVCTATTSALIPARAPSITVPSRRITARSSGTRSRVRFSVAMSTASGPTRAEMSACPECESTPACTRLIATSTTARRSARCDRSAASATGGCPGVVICASLGHERKTTRMTDVPRPAAEKTGQSSVREQP